MPGFFHGRDGMDCKEMILSDDFYDILLDSQINSGESGLSDFSHCMLELIGDYHILYLDSREAEELNITRYRYAYIPKCYALLSEESYICEQMIDARKQAQIKSAQIKSAQIDTSLLGGAYEESGITAVQRPPLSLTGEGILIGLIDTGVRYWLDEFVREDGRSKIFSIWDQTVQEGEPPKGLIYGTEYTQEMLQEALQRRREGQADEIVHEDTDGHGTQLVSIALRAAPGAEVIMVKCRQAKPHLKAFYGIYEGAQAYAEDDIMAGISYLEQVARAQNRPLVICITMGTNMGDHNGDSLLNRYLEDMGNRYKRCLVIGGGNEGNLAHHYAGNLELSDEEVYEDVEIRVSENVRSFSFELWGRIPNSFSIALESPDGERAERIAIRYGQENTIRFVYSGTIVNISYVLVERNSGLELIFVRFINPSPGIWTVRVFAQGGYGRAEYHMWLPVEAFLEQPVYFLRSTPYLTMTEPSYTENAVGHTYFDSSNGSFAINSGRGGNQSGQLTPALSVAGVDVASISGAVTGSSAAAALMAGAAAQFMEWVILKQGDQLLTSMEVRNYFIRGAKRMQDEIYPNATWGYGRMTIEGIFRELVEKI